MHKLGFFMSRWSVPNDFGWSVCRTKSGFETQGGGFEWFGGSPAHEALTAYGALEFQDMSQVFPVDPALLQRTKAWLRGRANGSGGFLRDPKSLDSFGRAPDEIVRTVFEMFR